MSSRARVQIKWAGDVERSIVWIKARAVLHNMLMGLGDAWLDGLAEYDDESDSESAPPEDRDADAFAFRRVVKQRAIAKGSSKVVYFGTESNDATEIVRLWKEAGTKVANAAINARDRLPSRLHLVVRIDLVVVSFWRTSSTRSSWFRACRFSWISMSR